MAIHRLLMCVAVAAVCASLAHAQGPDGVAAGPPAQPGSRCRVEGHVTSGQGALPGASMVVHVGDALKAATSTDVDGKYTIVFAPDATYHVSADLTAFAPVERDVTLAAPPCDTTVDFELTLKPRHLPLTTAPAAGEPTRRQEAAAPSAPRGRGGAAAQRFETLNLQTDTNGAALEGAPTEDATDVTRLLPPGFSLQSAQADAIAISGSGDATSLDRGALNDRLQAIGLGQFDPATGQFAAGFGPGGGQFPGGGGGFGGPGQVGGPGGPDQIGGGRGGGPGGRGGFVLGGRGARGQNPYQGSTTYTFGGSALNTAPYQLRPDVPITQPPFSRNNFGATFGGPLKIPGLYADTNRRTNFQLNYTGNRSNNVFDQYATVPTEAMRSGDFSGSAVQLIDPETGQPFAGNQIPAGRWIRPHCPCCPTFRRRICRARRRTITSRRRRTRPPTTSACGSRRTSRPRCPRGRAWRIRWRRRGPWRRRAFRRSRRARRWAGDQHHAERPAAVPAERD